MSRILFAFVNLFCICYTANAQRFTITTPDDTICKGSTTTLSVPANGRRVYWTPVEGLSNSTGESVTAKPLITTTYKASVLDSTPDWKIIVSGGSHTIALKKDGSLWGWGSNSGGQVGDNTTTTKFEPVLISADTNWKTICTGDISSYAIKKDGTLWGWGTNSSGQVGDGTTVNKLIPTQIGTETDWAQISAGTSHVLALKNDGSLWAWGNNSLGKLGDETTTQRNAPIRIGVDVDWKSVSAGGGHSIGVKQNGTFYAWGSNSSGQLGDGTTTSKNVPTYIDGWGGDSSVLWVSISAGITSCLGIKGNGTLWGWGTNTSGQLGDNSTTQRKSPVMIGTDSNWVSFIIKSTHSIALKANGTLWAWGSNVNGQVGDGTTVNKLIPTQIGTETDWKSITAGTGHSMGLKVDGSCYGWGANTGGQLGTTYDNIWPQQVNAHTNWKKVHQGLGSATLAIKTDGTLWSWGTNGNGQLGNGTPVTTMQSTPGQIGTDTNWADIFCRNSFVIALKTDGTLWSWGANTNGQLGDGTNVAKPTPVQIGSDANWSNMISVNGTSVFAIRTNGTLWAWGYNAAGQLGDGTSANKLVPTQIGTDTIWKYISTTGTITFGLKKDGSLWGWGTNSQGYLGDGTTTTRLTPVRVGTDTNWVNVIVGGTTNFALKSNGTLWGWGSNSSGMLGNGTIMNQYSPIRYGTDSNWAGATIVSSAVLALKKNGTLWGSGANNLGVLGDGTFTNALTPVQVGSDSNWSIVQSYLASVYAQKKDGSVWAWGNNISRQLGDGTRINRNTPVRIMADTNWLSIIPGSSCAFVIRKDNSLWSWGLNTSGQMGNGLPSNTPYPLLQIDTNLQTIVVDTIHAKFSVSSLESCLTGNVFAFNSASASNVGIRQQQWYFGNGGTSSLADPSFSYTSHGSFDVKLVSTSNTGCNDSLSKTITVHPLPAVGFSVNDSDQCQSGNQFNFTDTTSGITLTRAWEFGNGNTSNGINPVVGYTTPGNFSVKLVSINNYGCKDSVTKSVNVLPTPSVGFTINDTDQCLGGNQFVLNDTSFVSGGIISRTWSFGNGDTSGLVAPTTAYTTAGNHTIKLRSVSNAGCADSIVKNIIVYPNPTVAFSVNDSDQCLSNNQFELNDQSTITGGTATRVWSFGNGNTSNVNAPTIVYTTPGKYDIKLLVANSIGCADSITQTVTVNANPSAGFTLNKSNQCFNGNRFELNDTTQNVSGTLQRNWDFGNGYASTKKDPQVSYDHVADFNITLKVIDNNGCADSIVKVVNVHPNPTAGFTINQSSQCLKLNQFIFDDTTSFSTDTLTHFWQFGDGSVSDQSSPFYSYTKAGLYVVKLYVSSVFGCQDSVAKQVLVNAPDAQSLCMVTVDSITGKNALIWQRSNKASQVGYKIYKETTANVFDAIGYVPSDSLGLFIDTSSTPDSKADKYLLTAIDSCGGESEQSVAHKTLHLSITAGSGQSSVLNWTSYEGLAGNTIIIYRGTASGWLIPIATVQASSNSFTDVAPLNGMNYYMVAIDLGKTCDPTLFGKAAVLATHSNIVLVNRTGIADLAELEGLRVYPNPAKGTVNIEFEAKADETEIELYDISGRQVYNLTYTGVTGFLSKTIDISSLQQGVYIAKITNGTQSKNVKLIVN